MTHPFTPVALVAFLSLPAVGAAQNLIAPTRNTQSIHQSVHSTCTALGTCPTTLPPQTPTLNYWPGGSAWDGTTNSLWVTTGQVLERRSVTPCGLNCGPIPCPKSSLVAEAMGMDINELSNEMWILDDAGIVTRCSNSCPPAVLGSFAPLPSIALAGNNAPTAIAIDEMHGLVFYTTSDFAGSGSAVHVAQLATPALIFQSTPMTICFATLITGAAVHPGLGKLYVTNGRETYDWNFTYNPSGPTVVFASGVCCTGIAPLGDPYIDLSIRWAPAIPAGEPCANGTCPPCPMAHVLRNAPLLGTNLQLGLDLAPPGIPVWCLINFGSCQTTGPSPAPLCGPLLVPIGGAPLAALGFVVTTGTNCNASATIVLPIPPNVAYLGTPLASQFIGLCAPSGTTMSNCLSWVLQ